MILILEIDEKNLEFADLFLRSVYKFEKEFQSWQSGLPVDIGKIRDLLLPLLDKMDHAFREVLDYTQVFFERNLSVSASSCSGLISGFIGKKAEFRKGRLDASSLSRLFS